MGWRKGVRISWSVGSARVRDVMYQLCRKCKDVGSVKGEGLQAVIL